jgi:hypothetical protein
MKTCRKCSRELPLSDYYAHPYMADGHLNICKACTKKRVSAHREANIERIRAYDRERHALPEAVARRTDYAKIYRLKSPQKRAAHMAVARAIRSGKILRMPCLVCGATRSEAHHKDYSAPLEVIWLCPVHHRQVHHGKIAV